MAVSPRNSSSFFSGNGYMNPNGQIPAYEFAFGDVNPPVHAWAAWRVYKIADPKDHRDRDFLESIFQKLLVNFTWWVNRKDPEGTNLYRRLSRLGQHRRVRPVQDPARRRVATAGGCDSVDGVLLRNHAGHCVGVGAWGRRQDPCRLRGHGLQVSGAFYADRRRHEFAGWHGVVG